MAVTDFIQNPRIRSFPDLTKFYGIGPDVLYQMPNWLIDLYIEELPRLMAESQRWAALCALYGAAEASDFRDNMEAYWDQFLKKDSDPGGDASAKALVDAGITSPEEHANMLAAMGVKLVMEPSPNSE